MALSWYAPLPHNSPHIYLLNILTTETHVLSSLLRLSVVAILVLSNIVQINSETLENTIKMSSRFKKIWKLRFVDFFQIHNHSCLYLGSILLYHNTIPHHPNCNPLLNIWAFFDMNFSNPLKKVKVKIF